MNRLAKESSPYLLQHKDNPVDWYPWCEEAFERARNENKPVLVSIGYSSCHWCHVMEHESFSKEDIAGLMNELFINIKVDREEYPDIDHTYMDAVQAMTGSGGWPLNVFVTADKKPFYGGTYFPPDRMHHRASWKEVLVNVFQFYRQNPSEVETQADRLLDHLRNTVPLSKVPSSESELSIDALIKTILAQADDIAGGFGNAPKFPSTHTLQVLLQVYHQTKQEAALQHLYLSLDAMAEGGIYDHVGGGFSRYSTDKHWKVPHFEKMLYDNALLLELYAHAFLISGREAYKRICEEIILWLQHDMMSPEGGFYSAQDADSEGEEGKYYCWTLSELKEILGDDLKLFMDYYAVSEDGNWEDRNIIYTEKGLPDFSPELRPLLDKLLVVRRTRVAPLTDTKVLLGWNALMNRALTLASIYCNRSDWFDLAHRNMNFILKTFTREEKGHYWHTWSAGNTKIMAYADDLAFLADALIEVAKITGEASYLHKVEAILDNMKQHYGAEQQDLFQFTHVACRQLDVQKHDIYDGALPSSNAIMARVLRYFAKVSMNSELESWANNLLRKVEPMIRKHPTSFAVWLLECLKENASWQELKITGPQAANAYRDLIKSLQQNHYFYLVSNKSSEHFPCFKHSTSELQFSFCTQRECLPAVDSEEMALRILTQET